MPDRIYLEALELAAHIGVPEAERAAPQRLTLHLSLELERDFRALNDEIGNTVDYVAVARAIQALAAQRPRCLLETLAEEIAQIVLEQFRVRAVEVELRKYILIDAAYVAVKLRRER